MASGQCSASRPSSRVTPAQKEGDTEANTSPSSLRRLRGEALETRIEPGLFQQPAAALGHSSGEGEPEAGPRHPFPAVQGASPPSDEPASPTLLQTPLCVC